MKNLILAILLTLAACGDRRDDPNYLGDAETLPKGEYIIYNYGSRHIVRCVRPDGKYYYLNDVNFPRNGIAGRDAHQYHDKTRVIIK